MSDGYKKVSRFYNTTYYKGLAPESIGIVSGHLRKLAADFITSDMSVLDVACGSGDFLKAAEAIGAEVSGIDISEKAIAACRSRLPDADLHVGIAEDMPFDSGKFDVVVCLGSLEHFLDQEKALKEMLRVGKADAIFIILVPNADFLTRKLGLFAGTEQNTVKEDVKPLHEWEELFVDTGMIVQKRWKDLHVLSRKWIYMNGLRKAPFRFLQALVLLVWPLKWQYQVYHLCKRSKK